jgi:hypothetical protein
MDERERIIQREKKWIELRQKLLKEFGKAPDMNAILLLIGINELGRIQKEFTKEEKQDLMHIAVCKLLSKEGYYEFIGKDDDGWPHYQPLKSPENMMFRDQEELLKDTIIEYFENTM